MFWTIVKILFYIGIVALAIFWWLPSVNQYFDIKAIFGGIWGGITHGFSSL